MRSEIRTIVEQTYRGHIGLPAGWSEQQQEEFLDAEAARLSELCATTAAENGPAAVAAWTEREGREPDYATRVGLLNNARVQADEQVLAEQLYNLIPEIEDPAVAADADFADPDTAELDGSTPEGAGTARIDWANPDRWRTPYCSEPTEEIVALVRQVWPDGADVFTIKAEYLLQARREDGRPLPSSGDSELARELIGLIEDDLRADGIRIDA